MDNRSWQSSPISAAVLGVPWLVVLVILVLAAFHNPGMWVAVFVCFAALAFLLLWVFSFRVETAGGVLFYSSLFGGKKSIELDNIQRAKYQVGPVSYRDRFLPMVRLSIVPLPETGQKPFHINLKVFRKGDVAEIIDLVTSSTTASGRESEPGETS